MKAARVTTLASVISLLLALLMGCSRGDGITQPAEPTAGNNGLSGASQPSGESAHRIIGAGRIYFDIEKEEVIVSPSRTASKHWDVSDMAVIWVTSVKIDNNTGLTKDWHLDVWLKNPTQIAAYNARAIFDAHEYITVVNYMGYTKVLNGVELRPFINWIKYGWQDYDKYLPQLQLKKEMVFRLPVSWGVPQLSNKNYLDYAIDVCWPGAIAESPYIYHEGVKQDGYWYASVIDGAIDIPVFDWQNNIQDVTVDLTEVNPGIGIVSCTPGIGELENPPGNPTLRHYFAQVNYDGPVPSQFGVHTCRVVVTDTVSKWELYDDITVSIGWDSDPPVSYEDGGEYAGLLDLIAGDGFIKFYYDKAVDPSGIFYIFYNDATSPAWDGPSSDNFSSTDCNDIIMSYPPGYDACWMLLPWDNAKGRFWSVDAWDSPNNKAHTTSEKWAKPSKPTERWLKLAGQLGMPNINYGSPLLVDMDNDGDDDVVIANRMAEVYCFDGMGGGSPTGLKWIFDTGDTQIDSSPAAYDTTGDGIPEIYITTNGLTDGKIFCINGATGKEYWHFSTPELISASCVLADLNGGGLDVVIADKDGNVYALDGNVGSEIWPTHFATGHGIGSSPAAADVNGDDIPDITFGCYDGTVYMVDGATGTLIWSYFVADGLNSVVSSPALFDANGDHIPDVVVGATDMVVCIDGAGTGGGDTDAIWTAGPFAGSYNSSPAIGDCNLDGVPDVVIMAYNNNANDMVIIDGTNGNAIWGVSLPAKGFSNVILADVTEDGHLDAIFGTNDGSATDNERYYIVNVDRLDYGLICVDIPTTQIPNQAKGMPNAPTLGDVNNDGYWDMAFGSGQGRVYVHNLGTKIPDDPALRPWTTFHANSLRNGVAASD